MARTVVYDFKDYKTYLESVLLEKNSDGRVRRGGRSRLAAALRCHPAYVSLVLNGNADFSLEQGQKVNEFFSHPAGESHYFLLLLQRGRAGTKELKRYFTEQLDEILQKRQILSNRLDFKTALTTDDQARYYSVWYYAAVHVSLTVPGLQTPEAISSFLNLPLRTVSEVLSFLTSVNLAVQNKQRYRTGSVAVHLGNDSNMTARSHTNWRIRAIASLDRPKPDDLHYSSVVSLAEADAPAVRTILVRAIEEIRTLVKSSVEETLVCYGLDLFSLDERAPAR